MLYLRIGENGIFQEASDIRQAVEIYAKHGGFGYLLARRLKGTIWEVMTHNISGAKRLRVVCNAVTKRAAIERFYKKAGEFMKSDIGTSVYSETEFLRVAVGA